MAVDVDDFSTAVTDCDGCHHAGENEASNFVTDISKEVTLVAVGDGFGLVECWASPCVDVCIEY